MHLRVLFHGKRQAYYLGNHKILEGENLSADSLASALDSYGVIEIQNPIVFMDPNDEFIFPDLLTTDLVGHHY